MKKFTLLILISVFTVSLYAQNRFSESIDRDLTGSVIYTNTRGYKATLSKDIFNNHIYKDNRNNQITYSKEIYPEVLADLANDEYELVYMLVDAMENLDNNQEKYTYDIFGYLQYENNAGMKASLSKDIFDKKIYKDSNHNEISYSGDVWNKFLKDFDNSEFRAFLWLMEYCRNRKSIKESNETDIFGNTQHKTNSEKGNASYGRDIFGNLEYRKDGFSASIETNIFGDKIYKDSNGNQIKYTKKYMDQMLTKGVKFDDELLLTELLHFCHDKKNYKEEFSVDIFDKTKYNNSNNETVSIGRDIFGNLKYEKNGFSASIEKNIFDDKVYNDSNGNQVKYKKKYIDLLAKKGFNFNDEFVIGELIDFCRNKKNYREEYEVDIFDNVKYSNSKGHRISIEKDIFDNMKIRRNGSITTIGRDIFGNLQIKK